MLCQMAAKQPDLQWVLQATHGEKVEMSLLCNVIDYGVYHKRYRRLAK